MSEPLAGLGASQTAEAPGWAVHGETKVVGVLGFPVEHTLSPAMHNAAFAALRLAFIYVPFSVRPEFIEQAVSGVRALDIAGVNVTIPHKESVIAFLDELTCEAREVGAVNTICNRSGRLTGDNTDVSGFSKALLAAGMRFDGVRAVLLGAGGAARAAAFALARGGATLTIANRTEARAVELCNALESAGYAPADGIADSNRHGIRKAIEAAELLVNATSVGMMPDEHRLPAVPEEALHPGLLVCDLVYRPAETRLLRSARPRGCRTVSGLDMLVHQGAASFELWTGMQAPLEVMARALRANIKDMV